MRLRQPGREIELLGFIATFHQVHDGVSPSFQECATALGISKSRISQCLDYLEWGGMLRRLPFRARAIELLVAWPPVAKVADGAALFVVPLPALNSPCGRVH
jgi:SOS-response transcriptional repressor LexA